MPRAQSISSLTRAANAAPASTHLGNQWPITWAQIPTITPDAQNHINDTSYGPHTDVELYVYIIYMWLHVYIYHICSYLRELSSRTRWPIRQRRWGKGPSNCAVCSDCRFLQEMWRATIYDTHMYTFNGALARARNKELPKVTGWCRYTTHFRNERNMLSLKPISGSSSSSVSSSSSAWWSFSLNVQDSCPLCNLFRNQAINQCRHCVVPEGSRHV